MNIVNCKITEFIKDISDKKIVCFGVGKQAFDMCNNHEELISNIEFFIDNDSKKQGVKTICGNSFNVYEPKYIFELESLDNLIIVITTMYFTEVIEQLNQYKELNNVECYIYPLMEFEEAKDFVGECSIEKTSKVPIPKVIHYCWFGKGKKNEKIVKCMESWKEMCPNYEIIEWNEDNFDINMNRYVKEAYEAKKYAFVSDFVRLYVLYNYGGIYMDTDVEVVKPLDELLYVEGFTGFETKYQITTGVIAAKKGNRWIKENLDTYNDDKFLDLDGNPILTTNVDRITDISKKKHGFIPNGNKQILKYGVVIYPKDFFCPKHPGIGIAKITKNTYTIHHFELSWLSDKSKNIIEKLRTGLEKINII